MFQKKMVRLLTVLCLLALVPHPGRLLASEQPWQRLAKSVGDVQYSVEEADRDLRDARALLQSALQRYRQQSIGIRNIAGWDRYLAIEELQGYLTGELNAERLRELARRLVAGHPGLQRSLFIQLREPVDQLAGLAETVAQPNAANDFSEQTQKLSDALKAYAGTPSDEQLYRIHTALDWLSRSGQADGLVREIQQQFSHPNFRTVLREEFVRRFVEKPISREAPVQDVILGTRIRGSGITTGDTTFNLLPADGFLRGEMIFSGTTSAQTVGRNGPATIYSSSQTEFTSKLDVRLSPGSASTGSPNTDATTKSRTRCVTTDLGFPLKKISKKIAQQRVAENKAKADRIATSHAETQLNREILESTEPLIAKLRDAYQAEFEDRLQRFGLYPEDIYLHSSADAWKTSASVAEAGDLAASSQPPTLSKTYAAETQIHQSMTLNAGQRLASRNIKNAEFRQLAQDLLKRDLNVPSEPGAEQDSITFADSDPFELRFDNGELNILVRAKSFYQEGREIQPLNILVRYKFSMQDGRLMLSRMPDAVEVEAAGKGGGLRLTFQKNLVRKLFERILGEEIKMEPIDFSERWTRPGQLVPAEFISEDGWLVIGWEIVDLPVAP